MGSSRFQDPLGQFTTAEQITAGALGGALAAVLSVVLRRPEMMIELGFRDLGLLFLAMGVVGGFLGAVLGPLSGKTLLRAVPTLRAIGWTSVGTALGLALAPTPADDESMIPALLSPLAGFLVTSIALWAWHGMTRRRGAAGHHG